MLEGSIAWLESEAVSRLEDLLEEEKIRILNKLKTTLTKKGLLYIYIVSLHLYIPATICSSYQFPYKTQLRKGESLKLKMTLPVPENYIRKGVGQYVQ